MTLPQWLLDDDELLAEFMLEARVAQAREWLLQQAREEKKRKKNMVKEEKTLRRSIERAIKTLTPDTGGGTPYQGLTNDNKCE